MAREDRQVNVRIAEELLERIRASSKASGRSLTAEFSFQLEKVVPVVADTQVKVRLPAELHNQIKASCQKSNKSINAEIVDRLHKSFPVPSLSRYSPPLHGTRDPDPNSDSERYFRALDRNETEREKKPAKKTTGNVVRMKSKRQ